LKSPNLVSCYILNICFIFLVFPISASEIYGIVKVDAAFYANPFHEDVSLRMALPAAKYKAPNGIAVVLESDVFKNDKFDIPPEPVKLTASAAGFDQAVVVIQTGASLEIDNKNDFPLSLRNSDVSLTVVPAKQLIKTTLTQPGVFEFHDQERPEISTTLIVGNSPYLLLLDETGEFLFEDLEAGKYQVKLFYEGQWLARTEVNLQAKERETVQFLLPSKTAAGLKL